MRVLYACRLFTGLESSVLNRRWSPTGAPTVFKMMEALDRGDDDVRFVLTCKDAMLDVACAWSEPRDLTLRIDGLRHPVTVLAGIDAFPRWLGRGRHYLREIRHIWRLWREVRRFRPDVIYLDNANVWAAGLFARLLQTRVILRLMGVYPIMREVPTGRRLVHRLLRWAYAAPFDLVICTLEGSGGETWLDRVLRPGVRRELLLNGVDATRRSAKPDPRLAGLPADRMIVLFVGKLESFKGCDEFLEAVLRLRATHGDRIHAVIVGTGTHGEALQARVAECSAEDLVTFIDRLPHDQVIEVQARADVYVSLNRFGNLSNANLEAIAAGACMVTLQSQPDIGIDVITDRLVPPEAVVRVPLDNLVESLAEVLRRLCDHPEERAVRRRALARAAKTIIWSWDERIAAEMKLVAGVLEGTSVRPSGRPASLTQGGDSSVDIRPLSEVKPPTRQAERSGG